MGEYNSSITRAWPIFGSLFDSDSTGESWLNPLLEMCRRQIMPGTVGSSGGKIDPDLSSFDRPVPRDLRSALGLPRDNVARLRNCFEKTLAPSADFLRWLIENPAEMEWPAQSSKTDKSTKERLEYGSETQTNRELLFENNTEILAQALEELRKYGPDKSQRKWWAFEGFTCVDVYLETDSLVLLVECKRNELLSSSTAWFRKRNQLGRNLEVASERARQKRKDFAVIVCSQDAVSLTDKNLEESFPHIDDKEKMYRHYWGNVLWDDIHSQLCPEVRLPNTVRDAIQKWCDR